MTQQDQRYHLRSLMELFVDHRDLIGYKAARPMVNLAFYEVDWVNTFHNKRKHQMDCSESCNVLCRMVNMKDPTGNNYDGFGNSAEAYQHLSHFTNPLHTMTGTYVTFGVDGASHSALVYKGGIADPMLWSHGTAQGPEFVTLSGFVGDPAKHHVDAVNLSNSELAEFTTYAFCSVGDL